MSIISKWLRHKSIVQYRKKLPTALAKDYGKSDTYLPTQVKATLTRNNLNQSYSVYALALFCTPETYALYCKEQGIDTGCEEAVEVVDNILVKFNSKYNKLDACPGGHVEGYGAGGGFGGDGGGGGGE